MKLNKEELQTIINLLATGKWNLSLQENQQIIVPLVNKLQAMLAEEGKDAQGDFRKSSRKSFKISERTIPRGRLHPDI